MLKKIVLLMVLSLVFQGCCGLTERQLVKAAGLKIKIKSAIEAVNDSKGRYEKFKSSPEFGKYSSYVMTEARASFEMVVDTGVPRRRRVETLLLNNRRLNHTGLRLSVDRTRPMRLGLMPLNAAGFRVSKPCLRWRFRQKDEHAEVQAGFEAAANQYTVTQWPTA